MGLIRAIRGGELPAGPTTHGITREMTDLDEHVFVNRAHSEPHAISGWHHHAEHTGCVYVEKGQVRVEWGPGGRERLDLASGDFYVIPPNTIHREGNPGPEDHTIVAFGVGSGPDVVNVDGPEPEA